MTKILATLLMSAALIAPLTNVNAEVFKHFKCSGMVNHFSNGAIADFYIGSGDAMCFFIPESAIGKRILRTCHIGQYCRLIGTVKNDDNGGDWSPMIIDVTHITTPKLSPAEF